MCVWFLHRIKHLHQQKHTPFCGGNAHKRCKGFESLIFCYWSPKFQVFWTHFSDTYLIRDSYGNSMEPKGSHVLGGPWKSHPTEVVAFAFRPDPKTRAISNLKTAVEPESPVEPPLDLWRLRKKITFGVMLLKNGMRFFHCWPQKIIPPKITCKPSMEVCIKKQISKATRLTYPPSQGWPSWNVLAQHGSALHHLHLSSGIEWVFPTKNRGGVVNPPNHPILFIGFGTRIFALHFGGVNTRIFGKTPKLEAWEIRGTLQGSTNPLGIHHGIKCGHCY